jgi:hypothetical protein
VLRASLIYGPQPPFPVGRPLFVQFVEDSLRQGKPTKFFADEFRWALVRQPERQAFRMLEACGGGLWVHLLSSSL